METVQTQKPKGLWWLTIGAVLFVPLPWYICLFGCDWVFKPLSSSFAWFRLILLSPWATPLAFILPIVYLIGIHYLLVRFFDTLTKKKLIIAAAIVVGLYVVSFAINEL